MPPRRPEYQSITLHRALAKGWGAKQGLNATDVNVLLWVSAYGAVDQPGASFVWFPNGSMDEWAEDMGTKRRTLFRSIQKLMDLGHLERREGTNRWAGKVGYGIPVESMHGCDAWANRPISKASKAAAQAQVNDLPGTYQSANVDTLECQSWHSPSANVDTPPPTLTWDDAEHNQGRETTEGRNHPLTRVPAAPELPLHTPSATSGAVLTAVPSLPVESTAPEGETAVRNLYDDGFDVPKDHAEDRKFSYEKPVVAKKYPAITTQLTEYFKSGWVVARETRLDLNIPVATKSAFQANLKRYLEVDSPEVIKATMDAFWDLVLASKVHLNGGELWRDFHNARAQARALALSRMDSPVESDDFHDSNARILAQLDADAS